MLAPPRVAGVGDAAVTSTQFENCEVSPPGSVVAVTVMNWPKGTAMSTVKLKLTVPRALVATGNEARYCSPSPYPETLHTVLAKNSRTNVVLGVLVNMP